MSNLFDLFKQFLSAAETAVSRPAGLPHPEEPMDPRKTLVNTDAGRELQQWLTTWNVPPVYWDFWKSRIKVTIYDVWPPQCLALGIRADTPDYAVEIEGIRQVNALAKWCNPGVIAHEQAHNSYALLSAAEKDQFAAVYDSVRGSDPYILLFYSINTYGLSGYVEGHAEVYRYIGDKMPQLLKQFYPKLF
jgi:hypothetical protein